MIMSLHCIGVHLTTNSKLSTVKYSPAGVSRLKARYLHGLPIAKTGWPKHCVMQYVRLAFVKKEDIILNKSFNEITELTLRGEVDLILKMKEPLSELRDIFHYQNKPCPRLILVMGAPGEYCKVISSGSDVI